MAISFKKLWKPLIDMGMNKQGLKRVAGISSALIIKLGKNENVNTEVLEKVCAALECKISNILEFVPDAVSEDRRQTQ